MNGTTILYRPVGKQELALIRESGFTAFPPRLSGQPIFYPVLVEEYAVQRGAAGGSTLAVPLVGKAAVSIVSFSMQPGAIIVQ